MPAELYGLILCGGQSSRMGQDKALLEYHGEPQGRYCHRLLSAYCRQGFLSCRTAQWESPAFQAAFQGLPVILDEYPDIGPMAGLLSAMEAHPDSAWLLLACDMPNADRDVIDTLVKHRNPAQAATAFYTRDALGAQRIEPLCAIYEPAILPYIKKQYQAGRTALFGLLSSGQAQVQLLDLALLLPGRPDALQSLNTPETARAWSSLPPP